MVLINYRKSLNLFSLRKILCILLLFLSIFSCKSKQEVNLYTSHDYEYSKPIIDDFMKKTGIKVNVAYDSEATKTVGLVNRLLAEKNNPQCDVFWNNEILRTLLLKKNNIFDKYISQNAEDISEKYKDSEGYWTGFGARIRVIVYNKEKFKNNLSAIPKSVHALTDTSWSNRAALSNPLIGTSATHTAAFFMVWGKDKTIKFFNQLIQNKIKILPGNSVVRDYCANRIIDWGITDSDDVISGILNNKPIDFVIPDQDEQSSGTLLIPNTVSLIKGAPHTENAKKLIDFLLTNEVEIALSQCPSAQIPLHKNLASPKYFPELQKIKIMDINYNDLYEKSSEIEKSISEIYHNVF